jgi:hypothetical protein
MPCKYVDLKNKNNLLSINYCNMEKRKKWGRGRNKKQQK